MVRACVTNSGPAFTLTYHAVHPQVVPTILASSNEIFPSPRVIADFVHSQGRHGAFHTNTALSGGNNLALVDFLGANAAFCGLEQ